MIAEGRRRAAGVLLILAWAFWLHRWTPAILVVTVAAWMILHDRLEGELGEALHRRWRRAWPPPSLVLIALLAASALAFVLHDASTTAKILPVGLDVLALSLILAGVRWTGERGPSPLSETAPVAIDVNTLRAKGETT